MVQRDGGSTPLFKTKMPITNVTGILYLLFSDLRRYLATITIAGRITRPFNS